MMKQMEKDDRLILSKLHIPYIRPNLVLRPHLQARIKEGIRTP